MNSVFWGGSLCGLAVLFGAFGAHVLKAKLSPESLEVFEVAVRYQMYHGLAILAISQFQNMHWVNVLFVSGSLVFSGSLYAYVFTGIKTFGMITPFGGTIFVIGWILLIVKSFKI